MSEQTRADLDSQLLDDFFGEADEHLVGIRQRLLQLETSVGKAQPDGAILQELFHDFHSFKGISALVGLQAAEGVAHATEDFLRLLRDGKAQLTEKGLEALTSAAQKLEQFVAAFRSRQPLPGYESLLAKLKEQCEHSVLSDSGPAKTTSSKLDPALVGTIEEMKARGLLLWRYTFTPNRELDAKGININSIRAELSKLGEILQAAPLVKGPGGLAFAFLIAAREAPSDLAAWEAKGMSIEPAELEHAQAPTPTPESAGVETEHNPFLAPSHIVRVDLKLLDDLMRITGEMVIHRSRLDAQLARLNGTSGRVDLRGVQEVSGGLGRSLRELREAIMRVRLVPVAEIFARMPFVVRDLARQTEKRARLKLAGQDTAVDKYLIERLKDPLLHLVRNAFSHGVETPQERLAASKPDVATIDLSAGTVGDSVVFHVKDDGRGINPNTIIQRARKLGLDVPDVVDNQSLLQILCSPGFSTRDDADRASGRGMGMSVVLATVRELGGNLTLHSEEGRCTEFTIRLPLTLAIAETLILEAAGQRCAIPQGFVREIIQLDERKIQIANGVEVIPYREGILPLVRLATLFRLPQTQGARMYVLVVTSDRGSVGLVAERVLGQREVVVSALRDPLIQVLGISGATELGDGKPVLILDGASLTSGSVRPRERELPHEEKPDFAM